MQNATGKAHESMQDVRQCLHTNPPVQSARLDFGTFSVGLSKSFSLVYSNSIPTRYSLFQCENMLHLQTSEIRPAESPEMAVPSCVVLLQPINRLLDLVYPSDRTPYAVADPRRALVN